jgi:hypothetical protein
VYLRRLQSISIYKAQILLEKERVNIRLLLNMRRHIYRSLTSNDLDRYLNIYPIACRLSVD